LVALGLSAGCAHQKDMTGDEHRQAAATAEVKAVAANELYEPAAVAHMPAVGTQAVEAGDDLMYNPTAGHLAEADRQMSIAFEHLTYADRLTRTEDVACADVPEAERAACPMLAPHVDAVYEVKLGVSLHLKQIAPAQRLAAQLRCHLAFAKANNFDRVPCPLFVKGVTITLRAGQLIDVYSPDRKVAAEVQRQARRMFGQPEFVATDAHP
jgi:hypothetical protein